MSSKKKYIGIAAVVIITVTVLIGFNGGFFATLGLSHNFTSSSVAYVENNKYSNNNYGGQAIAGQQIDWNLLTATTSDIWCYYKFDLSWLPAGATVTSATLNVPLTGSTGQAYYTCAMTDDNSWSQNGVTWSNKPYPGIGFTSSHVYGSGSSGTLSFPSSYSAGLSTINNHLKGDKVVTFVVQPDSGYNSQQKMTGQRAWLNGQATLNIQYSLTVYDLKIYARYTGGPTIQNAKVTFDNYPSAQPIYTDANGLAALQLPGGYTYQISVTVGGVTRSDSVTLNADQAKTYLFDMPPGMATPTPPPAWHPPVDNPTPPPDNGNTEPTAAPTAAPTQAPTQDPATPTPAPVYHSMSDSVIYNIVDQKGHSLPATLTETTPYNFVGTAPQLLTGISAPEGTYTHEFTFDERDKDFPITLTATVKVGTETYSASKTFSVSDSASQTLTISRRFFWTFNVNASDGSFPSGAITLTSAKESINVPISNGYGTAMLLDGQYHSTFNAGTQIKLVDFTVENDGNFYATIATNSNDVIDTGVNSQPQQNGQAINPYTNTPFYLLPDVYIYGLIGVLALGAVLAAIVATRRKK
ncbi:Uncharacterised protein [uncultured archaeon]|nr:Uncharacterised protein [uncultured archaeon]